MIVELGVAGPRIEVGEGGRHDTLDVFLDDAALARARVENLLFGVGEDDLDGSAVTRGARAATAAIARWSASTTSTTLPPAT
jgi:hypothetical protein